jgi:hypothetical protein
VRLLGAGLQTLGLECIVLGFVSYMAELWARRNVQGDEGAPSRLLVALAGPIRTLSHASPLVVPTVLGILLIALGIVLHHRGRMSSL